MRIHDTEEQNELDSLPPKERFLRAKAEHYLLRAAESILMSRFVPARAYIAKARLAYPAVEGGDELLVEIDRHLFRIQHRGNGIALGEKSDRPRPSELILVVDQDEQILIDLGAALRKSGYQVLGAESYEEALESMSQNPPDAVISEVNFANGPRGFELYHWIKSTLTDRSIPFLFLASRIDRETLIAGKRFGVDDFLQKPVDEEVVLASLVNCLSRRRPTLLSA